MGLEDDMSLDMIQGMIPPRSIDPRGLGDIDPKSSPDKANLKQKCVDFEAVLTSMVLKRGLKAAREINASDDDDNGSEAYREIADEQLAYHVGKQGMVGLGDMLYKQLVTRMEGATNERPTNGE